MQLSSKASVPPAACARENSEGPASRLMPPPSAANWRNFRREEGPCKSGCSACGVTLQWQSGCDIWAPLVCLFACKETKCIEAGKVIRHVLQMETFFLSFVQQRRS